MPPIYSVDVLHSHGYPLISILVMHSSPVLLFGITPVVLANSAILKSSQLIVGVRPECLASYLHSHSVNRTIPLLRPLWYADPADTALYTVPDAFLLGPDLLVAPMVTEGAISRDIRLPHGDWRDAWTGIFL